MDATKACFKSFTVVITALFLQFRTGPPLPLRAVIYAPPSICSLRVPPLATSGDDYDTGVWGSRIRLVGNTVPIQTANSIATPSLN